MGGGSKQLTSLYINKDGSNKALSNAYGNINGSNKEIFSRIYRYGKYTYTYDSHTLKGLYEADRKSDASDVLVNFDDSNVGYDHMTRVFYNDFYVSRSYSTSVSGSTVTITLNNPEQVVPSSSNNSYYFNGKTYSYESGVNGYWILNNGQTSYSASGDHFGYYITYYAIGWAESVGGNEVRYDKVLVLSYDVIKKLTNTEYINCDTQQYYSRSFAGAKTLHYTYNADYEYPNEKPSGMKDDVIYYKLLN